MSRRARVWLLVPLGVLTVAAASCGGSSPASSNRSTTTTSASTTSTTSASATSSTGSTTSTSYPPVTPTTPSGCVGVAANAGQSQGAAGTITGEIILSETQGATCSLGGYPSMTLTSASGASIPVIIVDGLTVNVGGAANQPASQVTLSPTQKLAFWYQYSDVTSGNETSCPTSAHAVVTLPGGTRSTPSFTLMVMPCDNGQIRVSPLLTFS